MKNLSVLLLCGALFASSCTQHKKSSHNQPDSLKALPAKAEAYPNISDTTTGIIIDTLYDANDKIILNKTRYFVKPPKITALPFGLNINPKKITPANNQFYTDLYCKNCNAVIADCSAQLKKIKIYKLPFIKRFKYLKIWPDDVDTCIGGKPFTQYFKLNKYRYRLPDINNYQCYYWCTYDMQNNQYPSKVRQSCGFIKLFYSGYLILYNPKTLEANIIPLYYDGYDDGSDHTRYFLIDKNYNIHLTDFSTPSDDPGDGEGGPDMIGRHLITISKQGQIAVKEIK